MRLVILNEAVIRDSQLSEFIDDWDLKDDKGVIVKDAEQQNKHHQEMFNYFVTEYLNNNLKTVLADTINKYKGVKKNPYLKFLSVIANEGVRNASNVQTLIDLVEDKDISVDTLNRSLTANKGEVSSYLTNPSLYDRDAKDFRYTAQVFARVEDPDRAKNYFDGDVDSSELYDEQGKILPAGDPLHQAGTIFGKVEEWAGGHIKRKDRNQRIKDWNDISKTDQDDIYRSIRNGKIAKVNYTTQLPLRDVKDGTYAISLASNENDWKDSQRHYHPTAAKEDPIYELLRFDDSRGVWDRMNHGIRA